MNAPRVAVIGGGIAGLSVAHTLRVEARRLRAPLSLAVLEASTRPGGHVQTTRVDGFLVEAGPNGFLDREPHTMELVDSLGLRSRLVEARPEARRRFIIRDGQLCRVPDGPASLVTTRALSWRGKLRLALEPFVAPPPVGADETVYEFAARRIGTEAAEMLVDAAASGISAGDSRQLSVRAQFPLMIEMEREHGSLIRAVVARRRSGVRASRLLSFDEGMGTLTGALADRLGDALTSASPVRALERAGSSWRLLLDGGRAIEADHVVLAVAARVAAPIVAGLDDVLATSLREFSCAGIAVVALGYAVADVPRPLDGYGYLVTRREGLATLGVVWESSIFPGRAESGTALLRVMLGGARRPDIVSAPEEHKVAIAREELSAVMGIRAAPLHVSVFSWPDAITQYGIGHDERRARVRDRLRRHPGMHVCGTSYDGASFNHAVKSGRTQAQHLVEQLWGQAYRRAPEPDGAITGV